jgi:GNAT superfamily N-acetyltransferase
MLQKNSDLTYRTIVGKGDELEIFSLVSSTGFFNEEEISVAVELIVETIEKGKESGYEFIFAEAGNRMAGYCCFGRIPFTKDSYDLYWIAVHADFQNKGIGKVLLKKAEMTLLVSGGGRIFIETSSRMQYEPTRRFYLRSGYVQAAILRDFYDIGDHKIIFSKTL